MHRDQLSAALDAALAPYRLLEHPFYLRWTSGEITIDELRRYTGQYRHFEAAVPGILQAVDDGAVTAGVRDQARAIRTDEAGGPVTHLELFDRFAQSVGATAATPSPAMQNLLDVYHGSAQRTDVTGLAAVLAYETQAAGIAATKAAALRTHGLARDDDGALAFWDLHADIDHDHGEWALQALADAVDEPGDVTVPAAAAARAWWEFLDEREAQRYGTV